jgi:hypothetical protein
MFTKTILLTAMLCTSACTVPSRAQNQPDAGEQPACAPTTCASVGASCDSSGQLVTCGMDDNGCLIATVTSCGADARCFVRPHESSAMPDAICLATSDNAATVTEYR